MSNKLCIIKNLSDNFSIKNDTIYHYLENKTYKVKASKIDEFDLEYRFSEYLKTLAEYNNVRICINGDRDNAMLHIEDLVDYILTLNTAILCSFEKSNKCCISNNELNTEHIDCTNVRIGTKYKGFVSSRYFSDYITENINDFDFCKIVYVGSNISKSMNILAMPTIEITLTKTIDDIETKTFDYIESYSTYIDDVHTFRELCKVSRLETKSANKCVYNEASIKQYINSVSNKITKTKTLKSIEEQMNFNFDTALLQSIDSNKKEHYEIDEITLLKRKIIQLELGLNDEAAKHLVSTEFESKSELNVASSDLSVVKDDLNRMAIALQSVNDSYTRKAKDLSLLEKQESDLKVQLNNLLKDIDVYRDKKTIEQKRIVELERTTRTLNRKRSNTIST